MNKKYHYNIKKALLSRVIENTEDFDVSHLFLDGITKIGSGVFSRSKVKEINFPDTLETIEDEAFASNSYLTKITIPESLTNISSTAFLECPNLTNLDYLGTVEKLISTNILKDLFYNNSISYRLYIKGAELQTLSISKDIPENCFRGCLSLKNLSLNCKNIGASAFSGCSNITGLSIGSNVTSIGANAFSGCNVKNLEIGSTTISDNAFRNCSALEKVVIKDTVQSIGKMAFYKCNITNLTIGRNVKTIGQYSFGENLGLKSVIIPKGVTTIDAAPFESCKGITIYCEDSAAGSSWNKYWNYFRYGNASWGTADMIPAPVVFNYKTNNVASDGNTYVTINNVKYGIYNIGYYGAFAFVCPQADDLEKIVIPESITYNGTSYPVEQIRTGALGYSTNLKEITIPKSVTLFQRFSLYRCYGLTKLNYNGTTSQWNSIIKRSEWFYAPEVSYVQCIDGTVTL